MNELRRSVPVNLEQALVVQAATFERVQKMFEEMMKAPIDELKEHRGVVVERVKSLGEFQDSLRKIVDARPERTSGDKEIDATILKFKGLIQIVDELCVRVQEWPELRILGIVVPKTDE